MITGQRTAFEVVADPNDPLVETSQSFRGATRGVCPLTRVPVSPLMIGIPARGSPG